MDANLKSLRPGDPQLIDSIVSHLKCEGIFDEFRKSCLADVDTKPAYQNLRTRVESFADDYLKGTSWRSDLNKNQLRDGLRRHIHESGLLTNGVDRIIDQIVNPKIIPFFLPKVVEIVYRLLGIKNQENSQTISLGDKDEMSTKSVLEVVVQSLLQRKDELFAVPLNADVKEELSNSLKKVDTKNTKGGPADASKIKANEIKSVTAPTKPKSTTGSILKTATVSKPVKSSEDTKPILKKEAGTSKIKHSESPKKDDEAGKKHESKSGGSITDDKKSKYDKQKPIEKSKSESKDELKHKTTDKSKVSDKGLDNKNKSSEEKSKSKDKSGSNVIIKKSVRNIEKSFSSEIETSVSSQANRSPSTKDEKSHGKKSNLKHKSSRTSESKSSDHKSAEKKSEAKSQISKEKFKSQTSSREKRKVEDEGSEDSKKLKRDSSSKEKSVNKSELDDGELSDVTVSSVHTSDLSDFDDKISISDIEDEDSGSQNQQVSKNPKMEKHAEESNVETAEEKKACLQISEDALMSSDELRTCSGARAGKNEMRANEPTRELRRQRKVNPKYTSGDFSTIFGGTHDKHSQSKSHYEREHKDLASDSKVSLHSSTSTGSTNLIEKSNLLGSPISDTPSEPDVSKCGTDNFHSPILSSDDDLDSNGSSSINALKPSPKLQTDCKTLNKPSNRRGSSPENYSSQQSSSQSHVRDEPEPTFSKKSTSKSDSRQRYDSSDLYKPRPVIVHSRRRGSNSIEKRSLLDTEYVSSGGEGISPNSSNDTGSPNTSRKSPKYHSEAHLPFNKRRRVIHN